MLMPPELDIDEESNDSDEWSVEKNEEHVWMTPHCETHPKVKEMMRDYYNMFDCIRSGEICKKAGVCVEDLNLGNACLNYILGLCNKRKCTRNRRHPRAKDADDYEVTTLCSKLKRGVDIMTGAKRQRTE